MAGADAFVHATARRGWSRAVNPARCPSSSTNDRRKHPLAPQPRPRHAEEKAKLVAARDALKTGQYPAKKDLAAEERAGRAQRRKEIDAALRCIGQAIAAETRAAVKQALDYEVPVAQVESAGLTATGGACENQLPALAAEFAAYRAAQPLWKTPAAIRYEYALGKDGQTIERRTIAAA